MLLLIIVAFLSGIITILSPCILPVLPIVLSGSTGGKLRPYGIIAGFVSAFTIFTLTLSSLVNFLNIPDDSLRIGAVTFLILFGLILLIPSFRKYYEIAAARLPGMSKTRKNRRGFSGGFLTGISLGLIWTPCVGPIMASVISLSVSGNTTGSALFITAAYSLGTSLPMMAIMLGGKKLLGKIPAKLRQTSLVQRIMGALLILTAVSISFGWDRNFQESVLNLFPSYGEKLTALENNKNVQEALNVFSGIDAILSEGTAAPPIVTEGMWFNSPPLSMEELKGKVVIIDFWTYSCINCVRTIPYLKSWYDTYKEDGLEIIGVHSPEFTFERDPENVQKAIEDLSVDWPVVQDNRFIQWQAYNNRYWPAKYIIDKEGKIRYTHFGEGAYEETEDVIRMLLSEDGLMAKNKAEIPEEQENESKTPETYLGYGRTEGFTGVSPLVPNAYSDYEPGNPEETGSWTLSGNWAVTEDYVVNNSDAFLELRFDAKDVFLVIEPVDQDVKLDIRIDGKIPDDTADLNNGSIFPQESRHYHLTSLKRGGKHTLKIELKGKARLFAFTFG